MRQMRDAPDAPSAMLNILLAVTLFAQTQPSNAAQRGVVRGRIFADDTGEAVQNARITVPSVPNAPIVRSDRDGRFELVVPASGTRIAVSKSGYVRREVPRPGPGQSVDIRLLRASAIAGRILDQAGDPVIGAQVSVESVLEDGRTVSAKSAVTDDNGEYRIGGLAAGAFVASVRVMNTMTPSTVERNMRVFSPEMATVYYSSATNVKDAERGRGSDRRRASGADAGALRRRTAFARAGRHRRTHDGRPRPLSRVWRPTG